MEQNQRSYYSSDGYIVDQARVTDIRYGAFTSDVNGCGWIAAFNFLKAQGNAVNGKTLADELIRYSILRGLAGTDLFRLKRMLRRHGYRTRLVFRWNKKARLPGGTDAGVIYYVHRDGPHFVAFTRLLSAEPVPDEAGEPGFRFFNAIGGKGNHFDTMRGFLTAHNVIPFALILIWPGEAKHPRSENPAALD
ncbi:MAG: hypothetical protein LLF75_07210 [Eubacteriales bacterium]|nr:hypothetical protein [Eubacteriales bacterium]